MVVHNEESVVHMYIPKSIILAGPCKEAFLAVFGKHPHLWESRNWVYNYDNAPAHQSCGGGVSVQE
jgi:hypothetical protein